MLRHSCAQTPPVSLPQVASADVLVPTTAVCGADVVNAARNLKLIVQPAAGYNNIAVEAAQARGIPVCTSPGVFTGPPAPGIWLPWLCHTMATSTGAVPPVCGKTQGPRFAADWPLRPAGPGINAASVAEAAIMMLLMLARRVPEQLVTFAKRGLGEPLGMQLSGKTLGIIGMGAIGAAPPALPHPPRGPPASATARSLVRLRRQACGWRGPQRRWACTCAGTGLPAHPPSSARC